MPGAAINSGSLASAQGVKDVISPNDVARVFLRHRYSFGQDATYDITETDDFSDATKIDTANTTANFQTKFVTTDLVTLGFVYYDDIANASIDGGLWDTATAGTGPGLITEEAGAVDVGHIFMRGQGNANDTVTLTSNNDIFSSTSTVRFFLNVSNHIYCI